MNNIIMQIKRGWRLCLLAALTAGGVTACHTESEEEFNQAYIKFNVSIDGSTIVKPDTWRIVYNGQESPMGTTVYAPSADTTGVLEVFRTNSEDAKPVFSGEVTVKDYSTVKLITMIDGSMVEDAPTSYTAIPVNIFWVDNWIEAAKYTATFNGVPFKLGDKSVPVTAKMPKGGSDVTGKLHIEKEGKQLFDGDITVSPTNGMPLLIQASDLHFSAINPPEAGAAPASPFVAKVNFYCFPEGKLADVKRVKFAVYAIDMNKDDGSSPIKKLATLLGEETVEVGKYSGFIEVDLAMYRKDEGSLGLFYDMINEDTGEIILNADDWNQFDIRTKGYNGDAQYTPQGQAMTLFLGEDSGTVSLKKSFFWTNQ